jgi:hypothetical protein
MLLIDEVLKAIGEKCHALGDWTLVGRIVDLFQIGIKAFWQPRAAG